MVYYILKIWLNVEVQRFLLKWWYIRRYFQAYSWFLIASVSIIAVHIRAYLSAWRVLSWSLDPEIRALDE